MNKERIKEIIVFAKECAREEAEYPHETFSAVLTALIIREEFSIPRAQLAEIKTAEHNNPQKTLSLREFVLQINPVNDVKRTATFGTYLENYRNKPSFTIQDIISCFREAKEPVPKNPSDKIQKCMQNGWIMKGAEDGTYTMTNSGIEEVKGGFRVVGQ